MKIANYTPYREGWVDARKNPVNTLTQVDMYNSETERAHIQGLRQESDQNQPAPKAREKEKQTVA